MFEGHLLESKFEISPSNSVAESSVVIKMGARNIYIFSSVEWEIFKISWLERFV